MRFAALSVALLSALFLSACGKSEDSGSGSSGGSGNSGGSSAASSTLNPSGLDASRDLSADLKKLMEACYAQAKSGDAKLADTLKTFALPNHDAWLRKTFGDELGGPWATKYGEKLGSMGKELEGLFAKVVKDDQSGITVYRLTDPADPQATGSQKDSMLAMKDKVALYTVKFIKPGEDAGVSVWSWAYVDGGFRLAGKK